MFKKKNKQVDVSDLVPFIDNIFNLSNYELEENDIDFINKLFASYFLASSNKFYSSTIDNRLVGVLLGTINKKYETNFDWKQMKKVDNSKKNRDILKLQVRIGNAMQENRDKEQEAELICFSVLDEFKGRGLGKNLISLYEKDVMRAGIRSYVLFTDINCNYEWYERNGYKLVKTIPIKIDDLPYVKKHNKSYKVMKFEKVLF